MVAQNKLVFLTVALFFGAIVLLLHQYSRIHSTHKHVFAKTTELHKTTEPSHFLYHTYNLTYLEELNDAQVKMNCPKLIAAIRKTFLMPPSPRNIPYRLKNPDLIDVPLGQPKFIRDILDYQQNGFFVEAGALDGETRSSTLFLERFLNWTGLLVEPGPSNYARMAEKKRKAWLSPSCLSIHAYPHLLSFTQASNKISEYSDGQSFVDVQCLPLYSLLLALNRTIVDYLRLDVKGLELGVLSTIPFSKLTIRTLSVEYMPASRDKDKLLKYILNQGYDLYATIVIPDNLASDFVFFKQGAVPSVV